MKLWREVNRTADLDPFSLVRSPSGSLWTWDQHHTAWVCDTTKERATPSSLINRFAFVLQPWDPDPDPKPMTAVEALEAGRLDSLATRETALDLAVRAVMPIDSESAEQVISDWLAGVRRLQTAFVKMINGEDPT